MPDVIAEDVALLEFDRFVDSMELDVDTTKMDAEDLTAFNKQKRRLIEAIKCGALVFNEDGEAIYTPGHKKSKTTDAITFHERTGASLMVMDQKKKGHDMAKTYAVMAEMCRVHPNVFAGLVGRDIKVCEAIFAFLMD